MLVLQLLLSLLDLLLVFILLVIVLVLWILAPLFLFLFFGRYVRVSNFFFWWVGHASPFAQIELLILLHMPG